jgi:nicotinate-nucleotide pyrophosphorylase (carboxylating)
MRPMNDEQLPADLAERLRAAGLDPAYVARVAAMALAEDLSHTGDGGLPPAKYPRNEQTGIDQVPNGGHVAYGAGVDVTTEATIPAAAQGSGDVAARQDGVVAGLPVAEAVFWLAARWNADAGRRDGEPARRDEGTAPGAGGPAAPLGIEYRAADGDRVLRGDALLTVTGPVRTLLTAERTALNLLCHLSGIATLTRRWVDEVAGTGARIRDTRKTLPGLRALQKYAVRCGGGHNHRMSLSDAVLIKDNHVAAAGSIGAAVARVRRAAPQIWDDPACAEVECDTLAQVRQAAEAGARLILLDNFTVADMAEAVTLVAGLQPRPRLEASGGLTLARAGDVAATGVDYLSVGALTHSAPALDIALDLTFVTPDSPLERHAADD